MVGVWKYLNREFTEDDAELLFDEVVLDGFLRAPLIRAATHDRTLMYDVLCSCLTEEGHGITDYVLLKLWVLADEYELRPKPGYDYAGVAKWKKIKN